MTVKEALIEYMKANGYEGLAGEECGCLLDELLPCGADVSCLNDCELGHLIPCPKNGNCECEPDDKHATHIKPGPRPKGGGASPAQSGEAVTTQGGNLAWNRTTPVSGEKGS